MYTHDDGTCFRNILQSELVIKINTLVELDGNLSNKILQRYCNRQTPDATQSLQFSYAPATV